MKFLRDVFSTFFTEILTVGVNFGVGVLAARLLSPHDRGLLALGMLLPLTLAYFADVGVSQAIVYLHARRKLPLAQVAGNAVSLALIFGSVLAILLWLGRSLLAAFLKDLPLVWLAIALIFLPLLLLDAYLLSILRARQQFGLFNAKRLLTAFLLLIGMVAFVWIGGGGLNAALLSFYLSLGLSLIVGFVMVARATSLRPRLDLPVVGEALRFGAKSYLQNLTGHLHYRLDVYLLALFLPASDVAIYTVATSAAELLFYLPDSVGTVLFPKLAAESQERAHSLTAEALRATLLVTGTGALLLLASGWALIPLVFGAEYQKAVLPFTLLLPGILAMAVYKVLTRNYSSRNRQGMSILAAALALITNVGLNLLLIPRFGVIGASVGSLVSYALSAVVLLVAFRLETGISWRDLLLPKAVDLSRYLQAAQRVRSAVQAWRSKHRGEFA